MKKITVISGKGGTGKTTVTANLAALTENLVLADCDVDAPNLHLLMNPQVESEEIFKGGNLAIKDNNKCIDCGICFELCNFGAISQNYEVKEIKCEGCGLCVAKCPTSALSLVREETGRLFESKTKIGSMIHAKLKIGAENSGKLVSRVKERAEKVALKEEKEVLLIDGSPGIGCPVIASLNGVDATLIVTEPTKSGLSDLKRVIEVVEHFSIPAFVAINKYNLNSELTNTIEDYCKTKDIQIVGKIPFSSVLVEAMRQGELVVEYAPDTPAVAAIKEIWKGIIN